MPISGARVFHQCQQSTAEKKHRRAHNHQHLLCRVKATQKFAHEQTKTNSSLSKFFFFFVDFFDFDLVVHSQMYANTFAVHAFNAILAHRERGALLLLSQSELLARVQHGLTAQLASQLGSQIKRLKNEKRGSKTDNNTTNTTQRGLTLYLAFLYFSFISARSFWRITVRTRATLRRV
jgi:hypothetical protein